MLFISERIKEKYHRHQVYEEYYLLGREAV
jgi:hypothetical protein